jgi:hypothetical protein
MSGVMQALASAAALRGELGRMLLALGITLAILVAIWAVEEWRMRQLGAALGWFGLCCLGALSLAAAALITVGLL